MLSTVNEVFLSFSDDFPVEQMDKYKAIDLNTILSTALSVMDEKLASGIDFAYFPDSEVYWDKPKTLDIYIVGAQEAQALNRDARDKDYATNVLSYPTLLPADMLELLPEISLGELVLCDDVLMREALEQNKSFSDHYTHLIVHGILHLLGFDHEISDSDADEMEDYEIQILSRLGIANPYV